MKQYLTPEQTAKLIELGLEKPCSIASVEPIYGMGGIASQRAVEALQDEGGDMFWQLMGLFTVMGWDADAIAQRNLAKLRSRAERGVIVGNGDNR